MIVSSPARAATIDLGARLGAQLGAGDVVVLSGELGGGKTAFTTGLVLGLGSTDPVSSPTFAIVQQYDGRVPIVHADVYRLRSVQELYDIGFEEFLDGSHVVVVEWGDRVLEVLPDDHLAVRFALGADEDERIIEFTASGDQWTRRLAAMSLPSRHDVEAAEDNR